MSPRQVARKLKWLLAAAAWRVRWERRFVCHLERRGIREVRPHSWCSWALGVRLYLAQTPAGERVMVKVFDQAAPAELEARGLSRMQGRGLAPAVVAHEIAPLPYVVLTYVGQDDLSSYLVHADQVEVTRMAYRLVEIVDGLHAARLVHRDLRPPNLLVRREEGGSSMVLIDFATSIDPTRCDEIDRVRTEGAKALRVLGDAYRASADLWDDAASALLVLERDLGPHMERRHRETCTASLKKRVGRLTWPP